MRDEPAPDPIHGDALVAAQRLLPGRRRLTVDQLSAGIYGVIVLSAALAAGAGLSLGRVVLTGLATVVVYWIAEEYAHGLAHRAVHGRLTPADVRHSLRERFTMVEASFLPLLVVLGFGLLGSGVSTAVNAGLVVAAASLAGLGGVAARRSGLSALGTLIAAALATGLGIASVLLKLALH